MYGLLVENLASFIRIQWGEGKWDMVRKHTGVDAPSFSIHHVYPETLLNRLARSAFQVLQVDEKQFFEAMGIYFVEYIGQYGYDAMLTVLGRHMRDFLNGLDNLHEYLKFSYTKMRAPSFYCDNETANGLRLHYRSRRRGFVYYVMGQIKQVGKHFYNQDVEMEIISEELDGETMHTIFQMTFDNFAFAEAESLKNMIRMEQQLPIRASIIFELFPFCIVFSPEMTVKFTGHALLTILKDLVGQCMTEAFELVKPLISFSFSTILERRNNIFELITAAPIKDDEALTGSFENDSDEETGTSLRLRGQMLHMEEWNMLLFLANPVMPDLDSLVQAGLFINDLSLHDCSRDLVLAGTQQSVELKLALDQEQQKSKRLEESMKKLDEEMKRTDELLYQMIPKAVADRLRTGENPVDTCEVFESVSILFSDVVTFTDICSRITPMQVVSMLNHMYSLFDQLTERNGVYKVETIGDSYMVVSGAPEPDASHSERICDMAMDMVDACEAIRDPSREGETIKIRVGCHSGNVVGGVVGHKMPRYCLFGDAVNTASRMESTSQGGRVQISEFCKERLPSPYLTELRGTVTVKGKGEMNTYWLLGRDSRVPLSKASPKSFNWTAPTSSASAVVSATAGAAATKNLVSQMSKQVSVSSEDSNSKGPSSAAGLVKDSPQAKPNFKKLVKQQSKVNLTVSQFVKPLLKTIEPTPAVSEPVTINGEAAQVTTSIVKPTPSSPESVEAPRSAFASNTSPAIPEVKTPVPTGENQTPKTPLRSSSPFRDLVRSVSPTPSLVPWLKTTTDEVKAPVTQPMTLAIPGDGSNPPGGRRSSSPRIMTNEYGATVVTWVPNEDVLSTPVPPANSPATPADNKMTPADNTAIPADNTAISANNPATPANNPATPANNPATPANNPATPADDTATPANNPATPANNPATPADDTATPADNTSNSLSRQNSLQIESNENNAEDSERQKPVTVLINGINGIRKGSREFRNKIKDKKLSTITAESMTDMGCNEFAAKQKQMMSQACNLL